ncbi:TnsA endonuclease N-terminal domain-containing protein [Pseudomonas chlororaphis]|uniref:TnsA endonuclease N-terminal domain-containing protein n=1 Tax=Pseudomonas chlororaphis TaxID=587753 RepID=UPI0019256087|nr:TnsA endonuclease N-terminal domain-containing protein [Pseudomonas chlororaphis]QQX57097.1 transposase [Pseudomonas chlororaphis subsp. aurantiaca]
MSPSPRVSSLPPHLTFTPARRVVSGRYGRLVTFFASQKNNGPVGCESLLEADFCVYLEYLPSIINYQAQPFTICSQAPDLRYTPDFIATLDDGRKVLYEIKSNSAGRDPKWQERRACLEQLLGINGLNFEYVEEHQFRLPIVLDNLRTLYHFGFNGKPTGIPPIIRLLLRQPDQHATIGQLVRLGAPQEDVTFALFHQFLGCNLQHPLDLQSQVWAT